VNLRAFRRGKEPPEDSVPMRVVVALAVEVSILAVIAQGAVDATTAVAALVLAPVGYVFSYRMRARSNVTTKVLLAIGMMAAFAQFLQTVQYAANVDQARVPLGSLFLWVQVLHAFDVPRRRDLGFSMASSLILMAEAGAISLSTSYLLFLLPWSVLAGLWLALSSRPKAGAVSEPVATRRVRTGTAPLAAVRTFAFTGAAVLCATAVAFLSMPRVPGTPIHAPPFALGRARPVEGFDGSVENPGLPAAAPDGVVDFAPDAYPGFGDVVDLRARGRLSDAIAFRVRATQATLWRAQAFDTYDGVTWTMDDDRTRPMQPQDETGSSVMPPELFRRNFGFTAPSVALTQTFYVDTPQPNVLFAAAVPAQVYFPASTLAVDRYGSIRAPFLLDEGLVYSVVSQVPVTTPELLRAVSSGAYPSAPGAQPRVSERYLQLPAALPSRVGDLARRITAGATSEYDRVIAIQSWLRANTAYDLDVPRDPAGVDAVDHFLFETRRGFCEQIASSMAVLLRTLGIPTRLVTGYGPGARNPLTGYVEVRQSDAHAWVEVFYPLVGWVPYDPTFGVPSVADGQGPRFITGEALAAFGRLVASITPAPVKRAVTAIAGLVRDAGTALVDGWPLTVGVLAAGGLAALAVRRRRRRRARGPRPTGAAAAFASVVTALGPAGHRRDETETPSEFLRALSSDPGLGDEVVRAAELVVRTFERERFSGHAPTTEELAEADAAAGRVRELVRR
jgi:transglutaminase-like putative cysteine protease